MNKIEEAQNILKALGLPPAQQTKMAALTLLAMCGLTKQDPWSNAKRQSLTVTKGIMDFVAEKYKEKYAPNTRETFRRHVLHQFVQARVLDRNPDNPNLPTNSPQTHYALTEAALKVIKTYKTSEWNKAVQEFIDKQGSLMVTYERRRKGGMVPVIVKKGITLKLSPGKHNEVQAAIVQEFLPRFASDSVLLYIGDTAKKNLFKESKQLKDLGIPVTEHDKLPDVILYDSKRNWLFLIEAVTSHGPMNPKRIFELEEMLRECNAGKIYVTAFPNFTEFRKYSKEIAWETEVWVAENPDHMIHFNGDRFMGPR